MSVAVAKRYATAFFKLAQEEGNLAQYGKELAEVTELVDTSPELRHTLESPVVPASAKKGLLKTLQSKSKWSVALLNLLQVMVDQERMTELKLLHLDFSQMADQALGQVRVKVHTVAPLGEEEDRLKGALEKALGKKVLLETVMDKEVLGGFKVQVGDQVFDASLKRELESLKEKILAEAVG